VICERLIAVAKNLTGVWIADYFFVVIVLAIDFSREFVPLPGCAMKIISRD